MQVLTSESSIEQGCRLYTKEQGCILLKLQKNRGWPDRILLIPGLLPIFVEFKKAGGELSPIQRHTFGLLEKMGYRVEEVDSIQLFKSLFGPLMSIKLEESTGLLHNPKARSSSLPVLEKPQHHLLHISSLEKSSKDE